MNEKIISDKPKVSIIMPCYNGEKFIGEAIESVLNQTYQNWELIIIDDGSTDKSKDILKKYITDSRIIIIKHKYNKGVPKTKNSGVAIARGEYIAFLDQDDVWLKSKLELQVNYFELENNDIGVVCTGMIFTNDVLKPRYIFKGFDDRDQKKLIKDLYLNPTNSSSIMMIKKQCFLQVGFFNEDLIGWDDYEFLMRIATKLKIKYIRRPLIKKRIHQNNTQRLPAVRNETKKVFKQILELHPFLKKYENIKNAMKLYSESILLLEQGNKNYACKKLKKSIKKNPKYFKAWLLYLLSFLMGKFSLRIKDIISTVKNLFIVNFFKFKRYIQR